MDNFNDIGISRELDWKRIKKLLSIGLFASIVHFIGDMILGWGIEDETLTGLTRMISAYTSASDGEIFASALLGLIGMTLEGLCFFGIYRLFSEQKYANRYRSGIFGYLIFGACGFHVPVCALAFLMKHGLQSELALLYTRYFILPALILFWIFFAVLEITHITAFARGATPYPKVCLIFSIPVGMLIAYSAKLFGNFPFANALACAWIAFGSIWTFGGLLVFMKKAKR